MIELMQTSSSVVTIVQKGPSMCGEDNTREEEEVKTKVRESAWRL